MMRMTHSRFFLSGARVNVPHSGFLDARCRRVLLNRSPKVVVSHFAKVDNILLMIMLLRLCLLTEFNTKYCTDTC